MQLTSSRGGAVRARPRPLDAQVVVITGASCGIGRETAVRFGRAGARVVVIARDEAGLVETVDRIERAGGTARYILCDVTDAAGIRGAVARVEEWFGRIDTWVGNAGVLLYGSLMETTPEEFRDVFEVNVIGQINGIHAAVPALERAGGGTLICVSSVEAVVTLPLHSAYGASKHALEGAVDALRRELRAERSPVAVSVVRPAVIDTPIYRHARNRMPWRPKAPPPYYAPGVVAEAILFAATHRVRTIHAGGAGRLFVIGQKTAPGLIDAALGRFGIPFMHTDEPDVSTGGDLRTPGGDDGNPRGLPRRGRRWSIYTWFAVRPTARRVAAAALLVAAGLSRRRR